MQGCSSLPSREEMIRDIQRKQMLLRYRYVNSQRHTIQVDWIPYMDEIAGQVGCRPNIGEHQGVVSSMSVMYGDVITMP